MYYFGLAFIILVGLIFDFGIGKLDKAERERFEEELDEYCEDNDVDVVYVVEYRA